MNRKRGSSLGEQARDILRNAASSFNIFGSFERKEKPKKIKRSNVKKISIRKIKIVKKHKHKKPGANDLRHPKHHAHTIRHIHPKKITAQEVQSFSRDMDLLKKEVGKIVVGQGVVVDGILRGILANGHVLIEGVPGIAKTLLIRTISSVSGCQFSRIQFTVDLLPTDITGITTYDERSKTFITIKGPIFANFIIADEINRAPPKTQSALLEPMQEKQVTIGKETFKVPLPFFVMANNNPLESSGTYPLPEAQVDRFLFKLLMVYNSNEDEEKIIDQNITTREFSEYNLNPIISPQKILRMQEATKQILVSPSIKKYIVKIVDATRHPDKYDIKLGKYVEWGCSPRAAIGLAIAAKADAIMKGKMYVTPQNIRNVAHDVMRHRLILNYRGQAENIKSDNIVSEILEKVKLP